MEKNREISKLFSRCITSLCLIIFETDSKFLKTKIQQNVHNLLISFTDLGQNYKNGWENNIEQQNFLQPSNDKVAKYHNIVQRSNYVAQCYKNLKNKIDNLVDLLEVLQDAGKIKSATSLSAVKNLLFFKLSLLGSNSSEKQPKSKKEAEGVVKSSKNSSLNGLAKKIFEFIGASEQPPDNKALFSSFSKTSTRTIRRHIKDLISEGEIKRHQKGKMVTYTL